ncbi:hypothetical protein Tco_0214264 [Tanacetum coccineum]
MRDIVRLKTERELVRVKIHDGNAFWNEIGVNDVLVNAARHKLTTVGLVNTVRLNLMLSVQVNAVEGDFINTSIKVNGECQIQALVDKKRVIITETSIRSDLKLEDVEGTDCLPTATIFTFYKAYFSSQWKFLIHVILQCLSAKTTAWNEFSSTMASAIIYLAKTKNLTFPKGMTKHKGIYVTPSHTKKVFANMKREGKGFSGKVTPLFQTMMVQALKDMSKDSAAPTDSHSTPIITQPSSSKPQKKQSRRKQRKDSGPTEPIPDEATNEEHSTREVILDLDKAKTPQAKELLVKEESHSIGKRKKLRLHAQEVKGRCADLVTTAGEVVTTGNVEVTTTSSPTTIDELTLAQTLIEIRVAKPKAVTTAAITTTTIRPKARGVVVQEPNQIALDEEVARNLEAQLQAELEEEERLARQKEKEATIALIESWDNTQALIEADRLLTERLQTKEQEDLTDEEKARLFVELLEKRKKHFAALRAQEKRSKPPTKAQKRNTMSTNLKNMAGYTHN